MKSTFYYGNFTHDGLHGQNHGWIMGKFMEAGPRSTDDLEIKYWEYPKGPADHGYKSSATIEVTFILKGATRAEVDGEEIVLNAGDYVIIQPGTPNNTVLEVLADAAGLTVKAPSDPGAKKVIPRE
jgi:quercetin dioxygenase-like cupin family protein